MDLQIEMLLKQLNLSGLKLSQFEQVERAVKRESDRRKKPIPEYKTCLQIWMKYYADKQGAKYIMTSKDGSQLKLLIKKCKESLAHQKIEPIGEVVVQYFASLLARIEDKWLLNHLTISHVNSQFNQIQARQSKQIKQNQDNQNFFDEWK